MKGDDRMIEGDVDRRRVEHSRKRVRDKKRGRFGHGGGGKDFKRPRWGWGEVDGVTDGVGADSHGSMSWLSRASSRVETVTT